MKHRLAFVIAALLLAVVTGQACAAPLWQQIGVVRNGVDGASGLAGGYDLVMSADGLFAYTAAYNSSAVSVFARYLATGALTQEQVLVNNVGGVTGIGATRALRLSPDGEFLYAAGATSNAIAIFDRDVSTGQLTFLSAYSNGGALNGLVGANAMNVSHDGKFLYASSETNHSLSTFSRDAASGALAFVETLKDGVPPTSTLNTIRSFTISQDDRFLYAPARDDDDLTQFSRDATTGKLTAGQVISGHPDYNGPTHITVSPDGKHAYVASQFSDSLSLFDVDSVTGDLTYTTTYYDNVGGFHYLVVFQSFLKSFPTQTSLNVSRRFLLGVPVVDNSQHQAHLVELRTEHLLESLDFRFRQRSYAVEGFESAALVTLQVYGWCSSVPHFSNNVSMFVCNVMEPCDFRPPRIAGTLSILL